MVRYMVTEKLSETFEICLKLVISELSVRHLISVSIIKKYRKLSVRHLRTVSKSFKN